MILEDDPVEDPVEDDSVKAIVEAAERILKFKKDNLEARLKELMTKEQERDSRGE